MKREDGRAPDQIRRLSIQRDYMKYAEGSCLIELGNTKVICTATADKNVPLFLRNSGQRSVVNLKKLGERTILIDCDVIQANGGTRTTSIVGGFVALVDCLNKLYKQKVIAELCVTDLVGAISVGSWQGIKMLDLTYLEDSQADVDMNIVMKSSGEFIEVQGTAEHGSFSQEDLSSFLALARKGIEEIIDVERNLFKDILPIL